MNILVNLRKMILKFMFRIHIFFNAFGESIVDRVPLVDHTSGAPVQSLSNEISQVLGGSSFTL